MAIYMWRNLEPWIYHNPVEGLISFSTNWIDWYTIADKNLWATNIYHYWDTESVTNWWYLYQWWNNYWFAPAGSITTSSTQVNASSYGPWNYYSGSSFIKTSDLTWWSSVANANLWWDTTNTNEARQWPCPNWFHVWTRDEHNALVHMMASIPWYDNRSFEYYEKYLFMPPMWLRDCYSSNAGGIGDTAYYWTSSITSSFNNYQRVFYFSRNWASAITLDAWESASFWKSIRPFANTPVIPNSSRTVLYPTS